jgi:hypothetical protein
VIYLLMADGSYQEVVDATSALREADDLVCRNHTGHEFARHSCENVLAFSADPIMGSLIRIAGMSETVPMPYIFG